jgi:hypothetical protein
MDPTRTTEKKSWKSLRETARIHLFKKTVEFQGSSMSLKDLIDANSADDLIDEKTLIRLAQLKSRSASH